MKDLLQWNPMSYGEGTLLGRASTTEDRIDLDLDFRCADFEFDYRSFNKSRLLTSYSAARSSLCFQM